MSTVRTTCHRCNIVHIDAEDLTLHRRPGSTACSYSFECPSCGHDVVQAVSDRMVPVLIGAGCKVEDWAFSDLAGPNGLTGEITEAEIEDFRSNLDRDDCLAELLV